MGITTKDIIPKMDTELNKQDYFNGDLAYKKDMIEKALAIYTLNKLCEMMLKDEAFALDDWYNTRNLLGLLNDKLEVMKFGVFIDKKATRELKVSVFENYTHYILGIMTTMQEFDVNWWPDESKEYMCPKINEDKKTGLIDALYTHKEADPLDTFLKVYDVFQTYFLEDNVSEHETVVHVKKLNLG